MTLPNFPNNIWNGLTDNRKNLSEDHEPDFRDYNQLLAELLSIQDYLKNGIYQKVLTSQIDRSDSEEDSTILQPVFSKDLKAGKIYKFSAELYVNADPTGGQQYGVDGPSIPELVACNILSINTETKLIDISIKSNNYISSSANSDGSTYYYTIISGIIKTSALIGGTLKILFAQSTSVNTSSILIGSNLRVEELI